MDKKKDRKRNLVPAHVGMTVLAIYVISMSFYMFTHSYKTEHFDNGTRAFRNAALADTIQCIISPVVIISGSMTAQSKVKEIFSNKLGKVTNLFK